MSGAGEQSAEIDATEWWRSQANLGGVADYMARVRHDSARTVAEVMSKPWNWPEIWAEYQAAVDVDVEEVHLRHADGRCVISLNGQGHLPCPVTVEQVREALETDSLALGYSLTGAPGLGAERAERVAHERHLSPKQAPS